MSDEIFIPTDEWPDEVELFHCGRLEGTLKSNRRLPLAINQTGTKLKALGYVETKTVTSQSVFWKLDYHCPHLRVTEDGNCEDCGESHVVTAFNLNRNNMGFNTTIIVMNDALGSIENDPQFGKKLADAIRLQYSIREGKRVDISSGMHANAASVIEQHHADNTAIVAVGGNYGTNLGLCSGDSHHEPKDKERLLNEIADDYGFSLKKEEILDYNEQRDGENWQGFRKFPDGQILDSRGYDEDGNRRQYWD